MNMDNLLALYNWVVSYMNVNHKIIALNPKVDTAAGLTSNLFATRSIIPHRKTSTFLMFYIADNNEIYILEITKHSKC